MILNKGNQFNEENIVLCWNNSEQKVKLDNEMEDLYNDGMSVEDDQFLPRNLTIYSNYARLYLAMSDKNRLISKS